MGTTKLGVNLTWKPDPTDHRDVKYSIPMRATDSKISNVDLRHYFPPAYNQGKLGSCTAQAIAAAIQHDLIVEDGEDMKETPSRLFIYFNERLMEGTVNQDAGAIIRDGIKSVASQGYCEESVWPYIEDKIFEKPSDEAYSRAKNNKAVKYFRMDNSNITELKECLKEGFPFIFGARLHDSFETKEVCNNGMVPMPIPNENCIGGHAILCVGFDDSINRFIIRNSWGEGWGDKGHCYMPYDYLTNPNLCSDFWTIRFCS